MSTFSPSRDQALWGAKTIAAYLGCSEQMVYGLAKDPGSPIYRPSGRYFAFKHEIDRWVRTKPIPANPDIKVLNDGT